MGGITVTMIVFGQCLGVFEVHFKEVSFLLLANTLLVQCFDKNLLRRKFSIIRGCQSTGN